LVLDFVYIPSMIFTGVMTWEVFAGDVCDCFCVDSNNLVVLLDG